jgi:hypothetical protein
MAQAQGHDFYSKENMKLIMDIFDNYMQEKHNISIETLENTKTHKKLVYDTMNKVYEINGDKPPQQLNVIVLTVLREHYLKISKTIGGQKPNVSNLQRETRVFGNRQVNVNELIPEFSRREEAISTKNLDRLILERDEQVAPQIVRPDISKLGKQIREMPEDNVNFMKRLDMLNNERNAFQVEEATDATREMVPLQMGVVEKKPLVTETLDKDYIMDRLVIDTQTQFANSVSNHNPKALFETPVSTDLLGSGAMPDSKPFQVHQKHDDIPMMSSTSFLNPRVSKLRELKRYLSINSADRNFELEPMRYKFSVSSFAANNDLQRKYKNIHTISIGKVIIPEEVIQNTGVTINQNLKKTFNYDFSFAYPYLVLSIDEFNDVYDGTNDTVRKAFSKLIYSSSYKAPNGRGYIILKPMQKEKKTFYPAPLSSFGKLNLSILRPNGELLNQSVDNYKLFKVEYEQGNVQYLKIVTNIYFDKNEFWTGDEIVIKNHVMTVLTGDMSADLVKKFNDFINRKEGHEVKEIGNANDYGFFRTFYIQAPGIFDKEQGRFVLDDNVITTLNLYNNQIDFCNTATPTNGIIMNNSLQNCISMELECLVDDAKVIEREII